MPVLAPLPDGEGLVFAGFDEGLLLSGVEPEAFGYFE